MTALHTFYIGSLICAAGLVFILVMFMKVFYYTWIFAYTLNDANLLRKDHQIILLITLVLLLSIFSIYCSIKGLYQIEKAILMYI